MTNQSCSVRNTLKGCLLVVAVVIACTAMSQPAVAQSGRMQGRITDPEGNGLSGVEIVVTNPDASPSTRTGKGGDSGRWVMVGITRGNWTFVFSKEGYVSFEVAASVSGVNRNSDLNVTLNPVPEGAGATGAGAGAASPELFNEGRALFETGDYPAAIVSWLEFATLNPDFYQVQGNLGNAYRELGNYDAAKVAYEALIAAEPANSMANYNMGEMLVESGDIEGAMPYFEKVVETAPDDPVVYYNVAELYFSQRQMEGAITYYKRAVEVDPGYLPAHKQLGFALVNSGDMPGAILAFEKYVELAPADDPELPLVKDVLAALKSG